MISYTQDDRLLQIKTPLGDDALLLVSVAGTEQLSGLFNFDVELSSESDSIDPLKVLGTNVTMSILLNDASPRYFNGFVSRFYYIGHDDRLSHYRAEIVPWLWFLTRTTDCRIFQNKTAPKIVTQIFSDLGFSDYDDSGITGQHPTLDYCVQYRETDFNFISRLLEQEGIFYWFKQENGKHTLVLADSKDGYQDCPEKNPQFTEEGKISHIATWEHGYQYRSGRCSQTDYNFETPSASLMTTENTVLKLANVTPFDLYDYPGGYQKKADGQELAKWRMEEDEAAHDIVTGTGRMRTFFSGGKFTLTKHPNAGEEGKSYVLTQVRHRAVLSGAYTTGGTTSQIDYMNSFVCIPSATIYRPPRTTPKPVVRGVQTAVVVGPSGEEIYTDKHGRVKVQFFWDREGKQNENSSCWVRVSQPWAGNGWGAMFLPRIGQEVIVDFLEGDPDRPIITGRVYNGESVPPHPLPDNATVSTIKSNSSKGGGGFNELRFEDKKGSEQIFIHAEKNQDIRVKNDCFEWIGNDRHLVVKNIKFDHIEVDHHETIDRDHQEHIGRDVHTQIDGKEAKAVGGSLSLKVTGAVTEVFNDSHSEQTTNDYYLKADNVVIEAMTNITIKVGQSYIAIEASGIKIGTTGTIELESSMTTSMKADLGIDMKGLKIGAKADTQMSLEGGAMMDIKAPMTNVKGDGMLILKGGMTMIN